MTRTRCTVGIILAFFLLLPLLVGGLLKAGHYTFVARTLSPWCCQWYLGPTDVMVNYGPVRGYRLTLNKYDLAAYRPADIPIYHRLPRISALVVDKQGHGISEVNFDVYNLAGQLIEDPDSVFRESGNSGQVSEHIFESGVYNVIVNRHGYLPIKKWVQVRPSVAFVKFILPRILHGVRPSHKSPAIARS